MSHSHFLRVDQWSGDVDAPPAIDALIGPGLRRAFPLEAGDESADDRFRLLLRALARRYPSPPREASPRAARD